MLNAGIGVVNQSSPDKHWISVVLRADGAIELLVSSTGLIEVFVNGHAAGNPIPLKVNLSTRLRSHGRDKMPMYRFGNPFCVRCVACDNSKNCVSVIQL